MIELYLDGKRAALPKDFAFDFVVENPYFTDAAEYTGEVQLTPKAIDNIKIFGAVGRMETTKKQQVKTATLKDGDKVILEGSATTVEYTPDALSVQLLGGNSSINFLARFENMYIDEMKEELGTLIDDWSFFPVTKGEQTLERFAQYVMAEPEDREWVMLPAQSNLGVPVNTFSRWFPNYALTDVGFGYPWPDFSKDSVTAAIQPRLCAIVRRIITALGYTVRTFDAEQTHLKYLYYVNVQHTRYLSEMLPHWTVSQFLNEIQKLFGCVFVFDTKTNKCDIKNRANFFALDIVYLNEVDDAFDVTVEETTTDIGNSNLTYNTSDIPTIRLFDEEASKNCDVREYPSLEAATTALMNGNSNLVASVDGHWYIRHHDTDEDGNITGYSVEEVNDLGALFDVEKDDTVALNIVPAKMNLTNSWRYALLSPGSTTQSGFWPTPSPVGMYPTKNVYVFDIDSYVHTGEGVLESNNLSVMPVAFFTSWDKMPDYDMDVESYDPDRQSTGATGDQSTFYLKTKLWCGWSYMVDDISETNPEKSAYWDRYTTWMKWNPCCALRNIRDYDTIYSGGIGRAKVIDTTAPHTFKIYDEMDLTNINKTYVIRGVKYVCAKVECKVEQEGFVRAKIGTFYRIE